MMETAYITHPLEEKSLRQDGFQKRIAQAIYAAIKRFIPLLTANDPEGSRKSTRD
ncbi:MAG: hypothetical protein FJ117_21520 [Deltaproteobacteria bacterium]|nr:hypothetical protein [Deltaproteobacteria bacterium]